MTEEIYPNEDKARLRRRLELLKREYERTAQRLQRAERRDAVHRHVQRVSEQIRPTESSDTSELCSGFTSELHDNQQTLQSQTNIIAKVNSSGLSTAKKIPAIQCQLAEITSLSSPVCKRSPAHRLRSRRSRLRLQNRERDSDTDNSQEKDRHGNEDIYERERQDGIGCTDKNNDMKGIKMVPAEVEKNQNMPTKEKINKKIAKLSEELENNDKRTAVVLDEENSSPKHVAVQVFYSGQEEVKIPPIDQSVVKDLHSHSAVQMSVQTTSLPQSSDAVHVTSKSVQIPAQLNQVHKDSGDSYEDRTDAKLSSGLSGVLDSCTLIEGLPFPVEYYIRTTRRMAAAHSSVDLDAVIHSQLSGGRGRRRQRQSQTLGKNHMTPEVSKPISRSNDQVRRRGNGQRGRRGRRRTTVGEAPCPEAAPDCDFQPDSLPFSEHRTESKSSPHTESTVQSELLHSQPFHSLLSPGSTENLNPAAEDRVSQNFKHLPDSQLYIDSKLLSDSNVYPIFKRRCGRTPRQKSQSQTWTNKEDRSHYLSSLAELIQALQEKNMNSGLLAAVDIQDFHLPDEDFGQLKLERLRLTTSSVEPLLQRPLVYNTRQSNRLKTVGGRKTNCEMHCTDGELFTPEPLTASSLEDSFPLCQSDPTDQSQAEIQNTDQPEKHLDTVNELKTKTKVSSDLINNIQAQTESTNSKTPNETLQETTETKEEQYMPFIHRDSVLMQTPSADQMLARTSGVVHINPLVESQTHMKKESHTLFEKSLLCPAILNLSPSLTSHTQRGPDPSLPTLGMTPHSLTPGSHMDLQSPLRSPSDSRRLSSSNIHHTGVASPEAVLPNTSEMIGIDTSGKSPDPADVQGGFRTQNQTQIGKETMTGHQERVEPGTVSQNNTAAGHENLQNSPACIPEHECSFDMENDYKCRNQSTYKLESEGQLHIIPENAVSQSADQLNNPGLQTQNNSESEGQTYKHTELRTETKGHAITNLKPFQCENESVSTGEAPVETKPLETSSNQRMENNTDYTTNEDQTEEQNTTASLNNQTRINEKSIPGSHLPDATHCSGVLQEMHTFKALEGGCVLDLCLVQWPSKDWCICVAGEWSVCIWAQRKGVQPWSLVHTWKFAQSVMSLQGIPDSLGLLCVTLGDLEITETRVLCCVSIDGPFSQTVVCQNNLQAVVGVSNCRLVCCSTPGDEQKVSVLTVAQEGRVVNTLPLLSSKQNIRTLAAVEGEKDALIGWTECKTLLIWNMKSGHLLQTVKLEETLMMTNCMKGYSYRGVLCVLLQNTRNVCDGKSKASLFTLVAMNPLTGKHITLTSINNPAQHIEQLIDGDVFGSGLVGVFQSGHLAVWDLRGGVAKVAGVLYELCRLARWAGPDKLLTGYLNGDVSVYQYKPR